MNAHRTEFPGLVVLEPARHSDERGGFVKIFHGPDLAAEGLESAFVETFASWSRRDVVRGMHFQSAPHSHTKLVTCLAGSALDVVFDLRPDSPSYGRTFSITLDSRRSPVLCIPPGLAHGFLSLEDDTCMHYQTSTVHAPDHDTGIRWNSFGFRWPVEDPIVSERDRSLPPWTAA